jgi:hypothetical protein
MKTFSLRRTKGAAAYSGLARRLVFCLAGLFCFLPPGSLPFSAVSVAEAAVPLKFTYQGNIRQNGFLVNGQREMAFRVYDSSDSLVPLWSSAEMDVAVSTGVFQVGLEPVIGDWEDGNLWLEIVIEGNALSPREELTSAPYAINSLMLSGKRYTTAASSPTASVEGELWYDTALKLVNFYNGTEWVPTSGSGLPGAHASTHAGGGPDPITQLGTHTVNGYVTVSSAVTAGWLAGDGSGLYDLNASRITMGTLPGDRIGNVIVSTHIVDGTIDNQDLKSGAITRSKLAQDGCTNGALMQWSDLMSQWVCGSPGGVVEVDPNAILNRSDPQAGAVFNVSSGTADDFNVTDSLKVEGPALIKGALDRQGLSVESTGNVGVGMTGASARLQVRGEETQNYSLAVGTGTAHQVVISTSGAMGVGTETPRAKVEVTGGESPGEYIMIFNSGDKMAAWLRNK